MRIQELLYTVLEEIFLKLNVPIKKNNLTELIIDCSGLGHLSLKKKPFSLIHFKTTFKDYPEIVLKKDECIYLDLKKIKPVNIFQLTQVFLDFVEEIIQENLDQVYFWGDTQYIHPTGFEEKSETESIEWLNRLYADDFIVKEKKAFIIDLERSSGPYLVSYGKNPKTFIDGAAQIASLSLGFNDPLKSSMALRPELLEPSIELEKWDVTTAYFGLLKKLSKLPYAYAANSGAEANEIAIRGCQIKYPDRKKIVAFEGSFHGRTLLALHATYNPSKRIPFETYPGIVDYVPFPEDKKPHEARPEPKEWITVWSTPTAKTSQALLSQWKESGDPLLKKEIESLEAILRSDQKEKLLAVIAEPMLCEGGDAYGSNRFFRALRLLTRALDVPLIFDEVQTGFGLGGPFFWFQKFNLTSKIGAADFPDAVSLAKKAQIGVCLTSISQDDQKNKFPMETSAASLYRGYLQAISIVENDSAELTGKISEYLKILHETVGEAHLKFPRNAGYCFAFDCETPDILNKLVAERFPNGTIFYPAGDQTARFRLFAGPTELEIAQIFIAIYKCFLSLSEKGVIGKIPSLMEFTEKLPQSFKQVAQEKPTHKKELPWKDLKLPKNFEEYKKITSEQWAMWFKYIFKACPEIIYLEASQAKTLTQWKKLNHEKLWDRYMKKERFTLLSLMWVSSRVFGLDIRNVNSKEAFDLIQEVQEIEKKVYEPERQDDPREFAELVKLPETNYLAARNEEGKTVGICVLSHLNQFGRVLMVKDDPYFNDPRAFYAADLTILPEYQGRGLGIRLKIEQMISVIQQGGRVLRSRNRMPEAQSMTAINRSLGLVVIRENDKDYGGHGLSYYQSIEFGQKRRIRVKSPYLPAIKNKTSLGNFVSPSYVHNMLFLKELLPELYRHVYLTSGRSETIDKMVKLLRIARPEGRIALSFKGDYFGATTAAARSLGGEGGPEFFQWPKIIDSKSAREIEKQISEFDPKSVLGFFMEPRKWKTGMKRDEGYLKEVIDVFKEKGIPVIFDESASMYFQYTKKSFFCSGGKKVFPDAMTFYCGAQLGCVAVQKHLFYDKPLMMISTWDGDEHSLNLFRDNALRSLK